MDVQVTPTDIQTANEVLTLLRPFAQEGSAGIELLSRTMEGMRRDLQGYLTEGTVEIQIGGRKNRVSKKVAAILSTVGGLADQWRKGPGSDYLVLTVETLDQWLALFRQRTPVTLTLFSRQQDAIAISAPGHPGHVTPLGVAILTLLTLNKATDELRDHMGRGEDVRLRPV